MFAFCFGVFLFYIIILCSTSFTQEVCLSGIKSDCSNSKKDNKYSKEANDKHSYYLRRIEKAKENYIPCNITNCGCYLPVIKNDLDNFKSGISKDLIENVKNKGTLYQIIDHRLYREKNCMFPARCSGIEHFLFNLLDKLTDMEIVINTRDWPQIHKQYGPFGPVFSFSKTRDYFDVMYPSWSFWEGGPAISLYPKGIGRWDLHRAELGKTGNTTAWEDKIDKAFFRGSRTSSERDPLIMISRENPGLVDAQYTKNQAWKSDADTLYAPPAQEVSFADHCKYKYLFNFRGVAASFRFKHILLCKSLVFHVGDEWQEFFYTAMKPWIHYIPVEANASKEKIREVLEFAMAHDDMAREIAENGYNFVWNNLRMKDVFCYWRRLLKRYGKLLSYQPQLRENMVELRKKIN